MMDDGGPTASIFLFLFLLLIEIMFQGFGTALQEINKSEMEEDKTDQKKKRLLSLIENLPRFHSMTQFVILLVHLIMGGYFLKLLHRFLLPLFQNKETLTVAELSVKQIYEMSAMLVASMIMIYIILTFGVIIPKRIAMKNPEKWAYFFINPIYCICFFFRPLIWFVQASSDTILRIFGLQTILENGDVTEEEIISMVNEGQEQGLLLASEAEMITNIIEFGEKEAQDIMTPRTSITAIDDDMLLKDAIHFMLQEKNSRYPVYEESIDYISGIINLKDALRIHATDETLNKPVKEIDGLIREAHFVPETRKIDVLFRTMQSMKIHMVIIVDEYGQTVGLVAMEDILEEIVGNILDEYDEDQEYIEETGINEYVIEGMTPLEELEEKLNIDFQEEEFDTLNGYLISKMKKIPEEGEEFEIIVGEYLFKVLLVENKMIQSVLVTKTVSDQEPVLETIVEN